MDTELHELEEHLKEGRTKDAQRVLKTLLARPLSAKEQGGAFVGIAAAYLKVMNGVRADYLAALDEAVEGLEELDRRETVRIDLVRKGEAKDRLRKKSA